MHREGGPTTGEAAEPELIRLECELNDCIIRDDCDALERIRADEYVLVVPDMAPDRSKRAQCIAVAETVRADSYRYDDF